MNEDDVRRMIDAATEDLREQVRMLTEQLNLYRQNGLDQLRTRNLNYHAVGVSSAIPSEKGRQGEPRLVTGSPNLIAFNVDGETTWESVALA